jgi:adenylate kinase family enzyme
MNRIVIIGTTGSGKTTLGENLGRVLAIQPTDLDALNWENDWQAAPPETFEQRVTDVVNRERWIISGNYSRVRDLIWSQADTIIWLDYPFHVNLWRLSKRTWGRVTGKKLLWNTNNRETWGRIIGKDSIIRWFFQTYNRRKRETPLLLAQPEYQHIQVIHHQHPRDTERFLKELAG